MRSEWIDIVFSNVSRENALGTEYMLGNPARDSLRAILLLTLFGLTFFAAMMATILRGEWARSHITSFVACIGGGVFLATCLLDLLPEALESFEKADVKMNFPLTELAIAGGFLIVLSVEQIVHAARERGLLGNSHVHLHDHDEVSSHSHSAIDEESESTLGACLLVLALSLHALFEGISLAVIGDAQKILEVFAALILHKCIVGFSLGVRLVQSGMRTSGVALCALIFSAQVLIGGLGGISIMTLISGGSKTTAALVSAVLQGIATGTFLYITTFEVLPHELSKSSHRLTKLACVFLGVLIVVSFMLIFPEAE